MRRALLSTLFGLAAVLLVAVSASASGWCRTDPVISLNGKVANIYIALPDASQQSQVVAATQVLITVPAGVNHRLLSMDDGFGYGYNVTWIESPLLTAGPNGIPVTINVIVPAMQSMPLMVEWKPAGSGDVTARAYGATNTFMTLNATLP